MEKKYLNAIVKVSVIISYLGMVTVNALANILPINGLDTGEISDSYPNLFAPAGMAFSIWGLIYLLLACYSVYQLGVFQKNKNDIKSELLYKINILFIISSVANACWIFAWHHLIIPVSLLLIITILISLINIANLIKKENLTPTEKIFIKMPFSIYFGWITIATIANATVFLVSIDWSGFGISEETWTVIILIVGMMIAGITALKNKDAIYMLVGVWAYFWIMMKHLSADGFAFQYPSVVYTAILCIAVFVITVIYIFTKQNKKPDNKPETA